MDRYGDRLEFHRPRSKNQSEYVTAAGVRWSDLLTFEGKVAVQKPAMSSDSSSKDTSTSSIPDIFDAIADNTTTKTTELVHTALNLRAQMDQSTAPTALDMGLEKAADMVPNDQFHSSCHEIL